MQEELIEALRRSVRGVFEPLFGERSEIGPASSTWSESFRSNMTGAVGLAGARSGVIAIHTARSCVSALAARLTATDHPSDDELRDTLCEIANMIAGNLAMHANGSLPPLSTSLPSVIEGENFYVRFVRAVERTLLPVRILDVDLIVDFVLSEAGPGGGRIWAFGFGGDHAR